MGTIDTATSTGVKFKVYSASDGNLNAVLISLGLMKYTTDYNEWLNSTDYLRKNVNFASTLLFEIYADIDNNEKYVKLLYNGKEMKIQNCDDIMCSYEQFKE